MSSFWVIDWEYVDRYLYYYIRTNNVFKCILITEVERDNSLPNGVSQEQTNQTKSKRILVLNSQTPKSAISIKSKFDCLIPPADNSVKSPHTSRI